MSPPDMSLPSLSRRLRELRAKATQGEWSGEWAGMATPPENSDAFFGPAFWPVAIAGACTTPPRFRDDGCVGGFRNPVDPELIALLVNNTAAICDALDGVEKMREARFVETTSRKLYEQRAALPPADPEKWDDCTEDVRAWIRGHVEFIITELSAALPTAGGK